MSNGITYTKEMLYLKNRVMLQKINRLCSLCNMLFGSSRDIEIKALGVVKEKYSQMFNKIIEEGEYEKYKEVEDIIFKKIAKIELNIDKYIYAMKQYEDVVKRMINHVEMNIESIYSSKDYQYFNNLGEIVEKVDTLKELIRLYSPYIEKNETEKLQQKVMQLKFDVLYRRQVEQLVYENGGKTSNLEQYDNKVEKDFFKEALQGKINSILDSCKKEVHKLSFAKKIEKDEIFKLPVEQILRDSKLLERLIIIDMKRKPFDYINLLSAKIFNAHICNIGNNPFKHV